MASKIYKDWEIQAILESLDQQAEVRGEQLNSARREKGLQPISTAKETSTAWMAAQVIHQLQHEISLLLKQHKVTGGTNVPPHIQKEVEAEFTTPDESKESVKKIVKAGDKIDDKRLRKQHKKTDDAAS